jgi:outer membrane protein
MRLFFSGFLSVGLLLPVIEQIVQPPPPSPIAYLSVQRIMNESIDAKAGAKRLEELRQTRAKEIGNKQKALEATRLELANAGGILAGSRRVRLSAQESQQQKELQELSQQSQNDYINAQRTLQADLRRELNATVGEIAKRKAIRLVLNEDSAVVWASIGTDLTNEVLERLNAAAQKRSAK